VITDLRTFNQITGRDGSEEHPYDFLDKEVRAEAIKWIKELEKHQIDSEMHSLMPIGKTQVSFANRHGIVLFLEHFFNITTEELLK
jgi:hypothetical protein